MSETLGKLLVLPKARKAQQELMERKALLVLLVLKAILVRQVVWDRRVLQVLQVLQAHKAQLEQPSVRVVQLST